MLAKVRSSVLHGIDAQIVEIEIEVDIVRGFPGTLKRINGILPSAIEAKKKRVPGIVVPYGNANEAAVVEGIEVVPIRNLPEVVQFFMSA